MAATDCGASGNRKFAIINIISMTEGAGIVFQHNDITRVYKQVPSKSQDILFNFELLDLALILNY